MFTNWFSTRASTSIFGYRSTKAGSRRAPSRGRKFARGAWYRAGAFIRGPGRARDARLRGRGGPSRPSGRNLRAQALPGIGISIAVCICVGELGFSEDAAYSRILVARAAGRLPAVSDALRSRRVHLTGLRLLVPHLTAENYEEVLAGAAGKSKREVEELVVRLAPQPPVAAVVRKVAPPPIPPAPAAALPTAVAPAPPRPLVRPLAENLEDPVHREQLVPEQVAYRAGPSALSRPKW